LTIKFAPPETLSGLPGYKAILYGPCLS